MPKVSIVFSTYNRLAHARRTLESIYRQEFDDFEVLVTDDGSSDGSEVLANEYPIRYFRLERPGWVNPARPLNIGIRRAAAQIVILQSAEVVYDGEVIKALFDAVTESPDAIVSARITEIHKDGSKHYLASSKNPRSTWFLNALRTEHLHAIRGFDEDYTEYGYDDDDLTERLERGLGLKRLFRDDINGIHQIHSRDEALSGEGLHRMNALWTRKREAWAKGEITHVRNLDREWGALPKAA